jgi:NAD(P)-dependent dehydrogenase (short-subunit alcohol dehydrogenase family)
MTKTILVTGSTDGIGFETAKMLVQKGHHVLLHGRSPDKLNKVEEELAKIGTVESYVADLSDFKAVRSLAKSISEKNKSLDVLINNAGVLKVPNTITADGLDVRFTVNTIAPYLLTKDLLPLLKDKSRVINLSSAAQAPVDLEALAGSKTGLDDMEAYAQSKLAITMWSRHMAQALEGDTPIIIAVNPASLLGSKMVKEGFGVDGKDLSVGAEILARLALDEEFSDKTGQYFDNDKGNFSNPHPDALNDDKCKKVVDVIENILNEKEV